MNNQNSAVRIKFAIWVAVCGIAGVGCCLFSIGIGNIVDLCAKPTGVLQVNEILLELLFTCLWGVVWCIGIYCGVALGGAMAGGIRSDMIQGLFKSLSCDLKCAKDKTHKFDISGLAAVDLNNVTALFESDTSCTLVQLSAGLLSLIGIGVFSPVAGITTLIGALICIGFLQIITQVIRGYSKEQSRSMQYFSKELRSCNRCKFAIERAYNELYVKISLHTGGKQVCAVRMKRDIWSSVLGPLTSTMTILTIIVVVGIMLVAGYGVGICISATILVKSVFAPLGEIGELWNRLKVAQDSFQGLSEVVKMHETVCKVDVFDAARDIRVNQVSCGLDRFNLQVSDISFKKGDVTLIMGEIGSGKTTFAQALCGMFGFAPPVAWYVSPARIPPVEIEKTGDCTFDGLPVNMCQDLVWQLGCAVVSTRSMIVLDEVDTEVSAEDFAKLLEYLCGRCEDKAIIAVTHLNTDLSARYRTFVMKGGALSLSETV